MIGLVSQENGIKKTAANRIANNQKGKVRFNRIFSLYTNTPAVKAKNNRITPEQKLSPPKPKPKYFDRSASQNNNAAETTNNTQRTGFT